MASSTSAAPTEVDAGEQTALVVRLLERLVTASAEVSRGLEAGGRAVVQVGRGICDTDDDVSRHRLTRRDEEQR